MLQSERVRRARSSGKFRSGLLRYRLMGCQRTYQLTLLPSVHVQKGSQRQEALNLLARMQAEELAPDVITYSAAASSAGAMGSQ